jgi:F0F1-type ATP synthase membrane subunit c/vacuolar-type H+-ATPase subunit K
LGIARIIYTQEKDLKDGSVMSSSDHGAVLSNTPYDSQVLGVVARDAAIIINTNSSESGIPVISNGEVYILVSTKDGAIRKGDLLASSAIPGVAVKAVRPGYVLGTAKEDANNPDTKAVDKIAADLNLHYFNSKSPFPGSLSDIFKIALLPTKEGPTALFKYIVAAAVVLSSILLGFLTFGRTAAKGVEALGRNPAASRIIYLGIIFNITIVVVIVLAGLTVAFLILRL